MLSNLAGRETNDSVRSAARNALRRQTDPRVAQSLLKLWPQATIDARAQIASLLLSREEWASELLAAIRSGAIQPHEISPADQQIAVHSSNKKIGDTARQLFAAPTNASREQTIARFRNVPTLAGSPAKGAELFAQNCASCHRVGAIGHEVGPDLTTLRDKEADYWIKNILDPNAVIEPRFVAYNVTLKDDRTLTGIMKSETSSGFTLIQGGGIPEKISRADVESVQPSKLSLMPEGLENAISVEQMADLLAFLRRSDQPGRGSPELVLRDPASVARLILDDSQPKELRETAISSNPQFAADLIREMTRDIDAENVAARTPWLYRIALAAGRRNDAAQVGNMLDLLLPRPNAQLQPWQATVLGAGLIAGVSERVAPRNRIPELLGSSGDLSARWKRTLEMANVMSKDKNLSPETRYGVLQILAAPKSDKSISSANAVRNQ